MWVNTIPWCSHPPILKNEISRTSHIPKSFLCSFCAFSLPHKVIAFVIYYYLLGCTLCYLEKCRHQTPKAIRRVHQMNVSMPAPTVPISTENPIPRWNCGKVGGNVWILKYIFCCVKKKKKYTERMWMDHSLYVNYLCFVTSLRDNFMFPCTLKTLKTEYIIYISFALDKNAVAYNAFLFECADCRGQILQLTLNTSLVLT